MRLWNEGHQRFGERLRVYCENYAVFDWAAAGVDWNVEATPNDFATYGDVLGWQPLRARLAARDAALLQLALPSAEHVAVTAGATQGIHAILSAARATGRHPRLLIPAPGFVGYRGACEAVGLAYAPFPLTDGRPDVDQLGRVVAAGDVVVLNTPHNPSGAVPTTEEATAVARLVRRAGGLLLVDGVYDAFHYDSAPPDWGRALAEAGCSDSAVFVNSLSKSCGVPGLRVGWVSSPSTAWVGAIEASTEYTLVCVPTFNQRLALRMLNADTGILAAEMRRRRDLLCELLADVPGARFTPPAAGMTLWARFPGLPTRPLAESLLRRQGVLLLPGEGYYQGDPSALRLSFGYPEEAIRDYVAALRREVCGTSPPCGPVPAAAPVRLSMEGTAVAVPDPAPGPPPRFPAGFPARFPPVPDTLEVGFADGLSHALTYTRKYVACQAIYHLWNTGLWQAMRLEGLSPEDAAFRFGMNRERLGGFLTYCHAEGLLSRCGDRYHISPAAAALEPYQAWFRFFVGGYGDTFRHLNGALPAAAAPPPRDFAEVSGGSCDISHYGALPLTLRLLRDAGPVRFVVDCGCGNGLYLAALCAADPDLRGVGLEPHPASRLLAERHLATCRVSDRVTMIEADALSGLRDYRGPAPDAVLFAFVLHELVGQSGEGAVVAMLETVRKAFPAACVVVVETLPFGPDDPHMATGIGRGYYNLYFLTQALTDQKLLPERDWRRLFSAAGFSVAATRYINPGADPTGSEIGFLLRPTCPG